MPKSRILNTEILFQLLVKYLKPEIICDIGTLDATHSILLRHISKTSRIIAFEANPYNYEKIIENRVPETEKIEAINKAVSNESGSLVFHIQKYSNSSDQAWMAGTSSLHQRDQEVGETEEINVEAVRLDEFLADHVPSISGKSIAIWIDVEGAGYEVLEGLSEIAGNIVFIQIEVETETVWKGQRLKQDVVQLMDEMGFIEVARGKHDKQHDLILLNREYFLNHRIQCLALISTGVIFYYIRKWGGHILSNLILVPFLGIRRRN
jgi:FkbM family methyltransferase